MSENPYEAPGTEAGSSEVALPPEEAAAVRTPLLTHEVIVRTLAVLFFIKAVTTLSLIPYWVNVINEYGPMMRFPTASISLSIANWIALSIACSLAGWGLWKFRRWAWILSIILLAGGMFDSRRTISLIVLYAALLFPLLLPKTRTLFSENYQQALRYSPKMKYGGKRVASVIAVLFLLLIGCGLIMEFTG